MCLGNKTIDCILSLLIFCSTCATVCSVLAVYNLLSYLAPAVLMLYVYVYCNNCIIMVGFNVHGMLPYTKALRKASLVSIV